MYYQILVGELDKWIQGHMEESQLPSSLQHYLRVLSTDHYTASHDSALMPAEIMASKPMHITYDNTIQYINRFVNITTERWCTWQATYKKLVRQK